MEFILDSEAFGRFRHGWNSRVCRIKTTGSLDLLTEVGTQRKRAVIVQLLVTSPSHGIAHSLYLDLGLEFQTFPICDVGQDQLCLPNLARQRMACVQTTARERF